MLAFSTAGAQGAPNDITLVVLDSAGQPVTDAQAALSSNGGNDYFKSAVSGDGVFQTSVPSSKLTLVVSSTSHGDFTGELAPHGATDFYAFLEGSAMRLEYFYADGTFDPTAPGGAQGTFDLSIIDDGTTFMGAVACGDPLGACCFERLCSVMTEIDCMSMGGSYIGDGTACGDTTYAATVSANVFMDISGTGTDLALGNDTGVVVPIGFTLDFFGVPKNQIAVTSNGYMTFGSSLGDFSSGPIPDSDGTNHLIAPMWDDWEPATAGAVYVQTIGAAPSRQFIAQWEGVTNFNIGGSATFQAVLFEGNNEIEFRYEAPLVSDPTAGVENTDGTVGTSIDATLLMPGDSFVFTPTTIGGSPCCDDAIALPSNPPCSASLTATAPVFGSLGIIDIDGTNAYLISFGF